MWLLHPQYWLFEGIGIFLLFLLFFRWFYRSSTGRRVARGLTLQDGPEEVAADAEELQHRAAGSLGEAELNSARAAKTAQAVRKAAGVPEEKEV